LFAKVTSQRKNIRLFIIFYRKVHACSILEDVMIILGDEMHEGVFINPGWGDFSGKMA
jgi:hypothetical protein